jgi:F420-dependent oxidoreductase-like protein
MTIRVPSTCLVVLVGPVASGKSTWASEQFDADQIVSADRLRGVVGEGEHDQRASKDAFDVADLIIERRLRRRLLTVVDAMHLDTKRRTAVLSAARTAGVPCIAVAFDTAPEECRARNRKRDRAVPAKVLASTLSTWVAVREALPSEGFDSVVAPDRVEVVPPELLDAPSHARRQQEDPVSLDVGLQISRFTWPGGPTELAPRLGAIAAAAEGAGFSSIWVMDHFIQIPQAGRRWDDMLESYATLGFLAASTTRARLGALVTGITYRNIAQLGKIVATLDVLSGGRAMCGLGAAWFADEHKAYGWPFPPVAERYALLEDALELLPLLWGPGSPAFEGRVTNVPEAICYPRPIQARIPILIGGSGERRTLRLVAQHADACNLFGDAATVRHKVEVLHRHSADVGRDPSEIRVTHLSEAHEDATTEEHVGRLRELADAGVEEAIVSFRDLSTNEPLERFAEVIQTFTPPGAAR